MQRDVVLKRLTSIEHISESRRLVAGHVVAPQWSRCEPRPIGGQLRKLSELSILFADPPGTYGAPVARVHYEIPDDVHNRAKAAAALQGKTLKDFLVEALEAAIEKDEKKRRR